MLMCGGKHAPNAPGSVVDPVKNSPPWGIAPRDRLARPRVPLLHLRMVLWGGLGSMVDGVTDCQGWGEDCRAAVKIAFAMFRCCGGATKRAYL